MDAKIDIIYEDDFLLVVSKPPNLTVNKGETTKNETTLQDWSEIKLQKEIALEKNSSFADRGGIVHRLDKETSGLLIIAKNQKSMEELQKQFKERTIQKKYLALVHGNLEPKTGKISAPIQRLPWNREHFGVFPGGKEAVTEYRVVETRSIASLQETKFTLVEVTPHTGRTHQIRVHMKYLGHPVVSDKLYAGRKTNRNDKKFCPRQFLHAKYLKITHPETKKEMVFESPLPEDLQKALESLSKLN